MRAQETVGASSMAVSASMRGTAAGGRYAVLDGLAHSSSSSKSKSSSRAGVEAWGASCPLTHAPYPVRYGSQAAPQQGSRSSTETCNLQASTHSQSSCQTAGSPQVANAALKAAAACRTSGPRLSAVSSPSSRRVGGAPPVPEGRLRAEPQGVYQGLLPFITSVSAAMLSSGLLLGWH